MSSDEAAGGPRAGWILATAVVVAVAAVVTLWLSHAHWGWGILGGAIGLALLYAFKAARKVRKRGSGMA